MNGYLRMASLAAALLWAAPAGAASYFLGSGTYTIAGDIPTPITVPLTIIPIQPGPFTPLMSPTDIGFFIQTAFVGFYDPSGAAVTDSMMVFTHRGPGGCCVMNDLFASAILSDEFRTLIIGTRIESFNFARTFASPLVLLSLPDNLYVTPLPPALLLFGSVLGLGGLLGRRRRRSSAALAA